jgi:hypothetical protein
LLQEILTEEATARSVFRTDSTLLTKKKQKNRGFEHENSFQEANQQNSSSFILETKAGNIIF